MAEIEVDRLVAVVEARTNQFERQLKRIEGQVKTSTTAMQGSFSKLNTQILSTGKTLASAFGIGLGAGTLMQLPGMINRAVSSIGDIGESATSAGVKVKDLVELTRVGLGAGLAPEDTVRVLGKLTDTLAEAGQKANNLKKIFDANNISLRDQNGNVRSTADMLEEVATLVANARNEQDQMTIATAAFGDKIGRSVLPLLAEGGENIRKMRDEASHLSKLIDSELVKQADEFSDQWGVAWHDWEMISSAAIVRAGQGLKGLLEQAVQWRQGLLDKIWGGGFIQQHPAVQGDGGLIGGFGGDLGSGPMGDRLGLTASTTLIPNLGEKAKATVDKLKKTQADIGKISDSIENSFNESTKAIEAWRSSVQDVAGMGVDALSVIAIRGQNAVDVMKRLAQSFAEAALQAALLGQGSLAGLFGQTSGGVLGSFMGAGPGGSSGGAGGVAPGFRKHM